MSFFDDLFGGSDQKQSQNQTTTTDVNKQTGTQEVSTKESASTVQGTAEQKGTQTEQQFLFSPENMDILNKLIAKSAGTQNVFGPQTAAATDQQSQVTAAALASINGMGADTDRIVQSAQQAAKLNFAENQGAQLSQFGDAVGSDLNSTVQLLKQKGDRDLATQLAAVEGDIRLKSRDQSTAALAVGGDVAARGAEGARSFEGGGSLALQDALKSLELGRGAEATSVQQSLTSGVTEQKTLEQQIAQNLIKEIMNLQSTEKSTGSSKGSTGGSFNIVDVLGMLTA